MRTANLAAIGYLAFTAHAQHSPHLIVELHELRPPFAAITTAQATAIRIYASIGISLIWQTRTPHSDDGAIAIELDTATPNGFHPGALAYAAPYATSGTRIHVFLDRVQQTAAEVPVGILLGYVIAHELGHVLEGVDRHSAEGIMQARWKHAELERMLIRRFPFSPEDAALIRAGVARRASPL